MITPGVLNGGGDNIDILVVFPGGPPASRVEPYIEQLAGIIAAGMKIPPSALRGLYFDLPEPALRHLREHPDSFIIGSAGFFLSRRRELGLVALAAVEMDGTAEGRFHLLVKKGTYGGLDELKGKTVSGNTLYEDPVFLRKLVFADRIDPVRDLVLEPTPRPLTAIRKLARGELDGVLVDDIQLAALGGLDLFEEVEVIYSSPPLPEVGLMMVDGPGTRRLRESFLSALENLGETEDGGRVFSSFGLKGFRRIDPGALAAAIRSYEAGEAGEAK